jgi:hypothetical protein
MRKLWIAVAFAIACRAGAPDPAELLTRIRQNVAEQLSRSANYTCTETLNRNYYRNNGFEMAIGGPDAVAVPKNELLEDRLRLDIAVSEGKEIYAWHGASKFSTSELTEIVRHGPVSTGQFVGYLKNIFLMPGTKFTYREQSPETSGFYRFDFAVPLKASGNHVRTKNGNPAVPFHGSFTVRTSDLQLNRLDVIDDELPPDSNMQSVHTILKYQLSQLFGKKTLVPSLFILQIQDDEHILSISRGVYSGCREYTAESNIHFDSRDDPLPVSLDAVSSGKQPVLPAGLSLQVGLTTEIDDETAYAGDAVEGVLLKAVRIPGSSEIIPKKAVLRGVITRFAAYFQPEEEYDVRIEFQHLLTKGKNYRLRALHVPSSADMYAAYGSLVPEPVMRDLHAGSMLVHSKHLRLKKGFSAVWKTTTLPKDPG